jgi:hypothetical protein
VNGDRTRLSAAPGDVQVALMGSCALSLHTAGNLYSNVDLLLHGRAEWQAAPSAAQSIRVTGIDSAFVRLGVALLITVAAAVWGYIRLATVTHRASVPHAGARSSQSTNE